jgi:hypothetical protein
MAAASEEHLDAIRVLLENGADVNIQDRNSFAALEHEYR